MISDRLDYMHFLQEIGFSEDIAKMVSNISWDNIEMPLPMEHYSFKLDKSPIEGTGIFATRTILRDSTIGPARLKGKRTPLGRKTNHGLVPNARCVKIQGDLYFIAINDIAAGGEILVNYRQVVSTNMRATDDVM